jgi:hypothetical protein
MRTLSILVLALAVAVGIDLWRKKQRPGPREPNKLRRKDLYWLVLVLVVLSLLSLLMNWWDPNPRGNDNRPIAISDR